MSKLFWANGQRAWTHDRRAYYCDWCGRVGRWDENWQWYGSRLEEDSGDEHHLCSSSCATNWSKRKHGGADGVERPRALVLTVNGEVAP